MFIHGKKWAQVLANLRGNSVKGDICMACPYGDGYKCSDQW